jgi:hypothetical protein
MHRIVRLRQAGGDEFEVLLPFVNHRWFSPKSLAPFPLCAQAKNAFAVGLCE